MIEIAMDDEKRKALLSGVTNPIQAAPLAQQKPGPMQEIGKTVLDTTINQGIKSAFAAGAGTPATAATATTAATPAVAGGLGPAAAAGGPYVLAALAAGKLFGLYSNGGHIKGPLYDEDKLRYLNSGDTVTERKDQGAFPNIKYPQFQGPISKIKYKSEGGEVTEINYGLK